MLRLVTGIHVIQFSQSVSTERIDVSLECNGHYYLLVGTPKVAIDVSIASVELLTSGSNPQHQILATDAVDKFLQAARDLINNGTPFYTFLRGTWRLPAYQWEMNK